jgi:hypothetical protein
VSGELVRHRRQLVKTATSVRNGIRALLAKHGQRLPVSHLEAATGQGLLGRLTPCHSESDRSVRRGHISKNGNTLVRWAAIEAIGRQCEPQVQAVKMVPCTSAHHTASCVTRRNAWQLTRCRPSRPRERSPPHNTTFSLTAPPVQECRDLRSQPLRTRAGDSHPSSVRVTPIHSCDAGGYHG